MKKLILSLSAVVALSTSYAQLFTASDAAAFGTFSAADLDGDSLTWGIYDLTGVGTPFDAQGECAISFSWDTNPLTPDNLLISPAIDCSGQVLVNLGWSCGNPETTASGWYEEHYAVYVVTDPAPLLAGTFPTPVFETTLTAGETIFTESVDISTEAANQATVYLVWRHYNCTDENWMFLDDINVTTTGGLEEEASIAKVFPNPATDELKVMSNVEATSVSIISMEGKVMTTVDMNGFGTTVNVSDLNTGVYFYELTTADGQVIRNTFVKK